MAEKSLKELRDEVALKMLEAQVYGRIKADETLTVEDVKQMCASAFDIAEAFVAARYDADKNGSRTT